MRTVSVMAGVFSAAAVLATMSGCGASPQSQAATEPASLIPAPELRAFLAFNNAQQLETQRKRAAAIDAYRQLQKLYPDSPQAAKAERRLKELAAD